MNVDVRIIHVHLYQASDGWQWTKRRVQWNEQLDLSLVREGGATGTQVVGVASWGVAIAEEQLGNIEWKRPFNLDNIVICVFV